jgi:hypothetical protein
MRISFRRALKIAMAAAAVTFGVLWPLTVLFYHLDPLSTIPAGLYWAVVIFAGVLTALWFAYGPFTRR